MCKIYKNILKGLLIIVFASSCEEWLDVTTDTQIRAEDQFKTEQGFKDALMGVYIGLTAPELYSRDMTWNMVDLFSQQYANLPDLATYNQAQQYQYKHSRIVNKIDALWNKSYNVIANINNALHYIDRNQSVLDPVNYSIIKGELLGLRAFIHFDLMRLYGYGNIHNRTEINGKFAIPYVTEYTKEGTPQESYDKTFELLAKDINNALELLKEDPVFTDPDRPADYYTEVNREGFYDFREQRMNYFAVKALQARMLAWRGGAENLDAARNAAEEVINNSMAQLINSESYPVASDPLLYPEIIFSLNVSAFEDIVNRYLDADNATNYDALYLTSTRAAEIFETSNANIGVADVRYNTLLDQQNSGLVSIKLRQGNVNKLNIMPLVKLPEMYYIATEYYASINDLEQAVNYLNIVRRSRGIIENIPADADQETVFAELFKEYRKEFISEGQLFFYYKRTGQTKIPGLSENTVVDDDIYVLPLPDSEIEFGNR